MSTRARRLLSALSTALSVALVSIALGGFQRPLAPVAIRNLPAHVRLGKAQYIRYHLLLTKRDTATGAYVWAGRVSGAVTGHAAMEANFQEERSAQPGAVVIHTHWTVTATRESRSFEASLSGTMDMTTSKTHLVGTIDTGTWRGQKIETNSQLLNGGPNKTVSKVDGMMTIWLPDSISHR